MRYVFIINPTAGKRNPYNTVMEAVESTLKPKGISYRCFTTAHPEHATELAKLEAEKGDPVCVFACGGDGTVCEVARGLRGFDNAVLGIFPCGSGNDYIKTFGSKARFCSLEDQLEGHTTTVDMIRVGDQYAINLCSLGVDAKVALGVVKFKKVPLVSGAMAYNLAVMELFLGRMYDRLKITIDDTIHYDGDFFFALAASGQQYGGGYRGAPDAIPDDGLLDFVLIKATSKLRLLKILPRYKRGEHTDDDFGGIVIKHRGRKIQIESMASTPAVINLDGEAFRRNEITFEVAPHALRLLLPRGVGRAEGNCK